jgi:hypothetical protein
MLHKCLVALPSKGLSKPCSINLLLLRKLQLCEQLLQLIRDAVLLVSVQLRIVAPLVDAGPKLRSHKESLDGTVHVASGSLVVEANVVALSLGALKPRYLILKPFNLSGLLSIAPLNRIQSIV